MRHLHRALHTTILVTTPSTYATGHIILVHSVIETTDRPQKLDCAPSTFAVLHNFEEIHPRQAEIKTLHSDLVLPHLTSLPFRIIRVQLCIDKVGALAYVAAILPSDDNTLSNVNIISKATDVLGAKYKAIGILILWDDYLQLLAEQRQLLGSFSS